MSRIKSQSQLYGRTLNKQRVSKRVKFSEKVRILKSFLLSKITLETQNAKNSKKRSWRQGEKKGKTESSSESFFCRNNLNEKLTQGLNGQNFYRKLNMNRVLDRCSANQELKLEKCSRISSGRRRKCSRSIKTILRR